MSFCGCSGCAPIVITPPNPAVGEAAFAPGGTRLILDPRDQQAKYTANRETDARTALTRGLREYLEQLSLDVVGGQTLRFERVHQTWGEPEDVSVYPSAVVYAFGAGTYTEVRLSPSANSNDRIPPPDGRAVVSGSDLVQDLVVEIWANSPEERMGLVAMLEDAMVPVDWRFGPLLELPHYHGERGSYEKISMSYDDNADDAQRRRRRAVFTIRGRVPVLRLMEFPESRARFELGELSTDAAV